MIVSERYENERERERDKLFMSNEFYDGLDFFKRGIELFKE